MYVELGEVLDMRNGHTVFYSVESPAYRKSIDACTNLSAARFHFA